MVANVVLAAIHLSFIMQSYQNLHNI